jgi:hypothetical protein
VLDKTGAVAERLAAIRAAANRRAAERLMDHYERYCTAFIRSLKCWRRGDAHAVRGRWAPYHDHLSLLLPGLGADLGWPTGSIAGALGRLTADPDPGFQQELQRLVAALLAKHGHRYPWADETARVQAWDLSLSPAR